MECIIDIDKDGYIANGYYTGIVRHTDKETNMTISRPVMLRKHINGKVTIEYYLD